MKRKGLSLLGVTIIFCGAVFLQGCSFSRPQLGPVFRAEEQVPSGAGLVYVYRPQYHQDYMHQFDVKLNDQVIGQIADGGYFPLFVRPGRADISVKRTGEALSTVTLDVQPGQTYYIKCTLGMGIFHPRPMFTFVGSEIGRGEILSCSKMPHFQQPNVPGAVTATQEPQQKPAQVNPLPEKTKETGSGDVVTKLRELKNLLDAGIITEEEYQSKKQELLDQL